MRVIGGSDSRYFLQEHLYFAARRSKLAIFSCKFGVGVKKVVYKGFWFERRTLGLLFCPLHPICRAHALMTGTPRFSSPKVALLAPLVSEKTCSVQPSRCRRSVISGRRVPAAALVSGLSHWLTRHNKHAAAIFHLALVQPSVSLLPSVRRRLRGNKEERFIAQKPAEQPSHDETCQVLF